MTAILVGREGNTSRPSYSEYCTRAYETARRILDDDGRAALAGGPPPVHVVADEVKVETTGGSERVTIQGSFIRLSDVRAYVYGKPVQGFVCLSLHERKATECRAEWKEWEKAAGTGKVVAVGTCAEARALLTVKIHKPGDKAAGPDRTYTPGFLGKLDAPGRGWSDEEPVKALQAFVKEHKASRARSSMSGTHRTRSSGHEPPRHHYSSRSSGLRAEALPP